MQKERNALTCLLVPSCLISLWLILAGAAFAGSASVNMTAADKFTQMLSHGQYRQAIALFDARMSASMSAAALQQVWQMLSEKYGSFKRFLPDHRSEKQDSYKVTYIPAVFERQTLDLKVVTDPGNKIAGFWIVPHINASAPGSAAAQANYVSPGYVDRTRFRQKPTRVNSADLALDAIWTMPTGTGPFPAIILVHGSGPNDKDESIGPNKPFKDLAEGLSSKGIAVLRYEKRTRQFPQRLDLKNVTVQEETVDDAVAAVKQARSTMGIDPSRVFVLGHSLGGTLVPRIGKQCPDVCGFVVLAGSTRPLEDVLVEQMEYLSSKGGCTAKELALVKEQVARVKDPSLSDKVPASQLPLGVPAKYWLDLRGYDPVDMAKTVGKPMFILQGGRDYQVTPNGDFIRWQAGVGENNLFNLKMYPKLNHLFAEGEGKATPQEYMNEPKHVSREVIDDIAQWIQSRR